MQIKEDVLAYVRETYQVDIEYLWKSGYGDPTGITVDDGSMKEDPAGDMLWTTEQIYLIFPPTRLPKSSSNPLSRTEFSDQTMTSVVVRITLYKSGKFSK
jgi:hypothetical protein